MSVYWRSSPYSLKKPFSSPIRENTLSNRPVTSVAFTVAESRHLHEQIPGGHSKNLFLKDKRGALKLVVALQDAVIELKSLHPRLGATGRFSFGSPELLRETLGIAPGSVTPFAAINDQDGRVKVVLDQAMLAHETMNFHPLVNTMTTSIAREDLLRFLEATGHPPRIALVSGGMTQ